VLRQAFDKLYAASNGEWFLYDCRKLRAKAAEAGENKDRPVQRAEKESRVE